MKTIGRIILSVFVLVTITGCELYQTNEGIGVIGHNGGWFVCFDNDHCEGR
ncbi:MAG: hypothetical protein GWN55_06875 [Phycisphaerae bacterium]|nr:hypothetical protein [Phycisphaerae bacterium]NIU25704.1 hypothetical protein [candidate division KSB1 bacterium]NIP55089.1 hypothetical protein [Phycisphaerae bacterium]NIS52697.1 hypothetical protein [Phycisphaerae bacterium]NIV01033.1 hypothetical protein [Phycisphaerae bacterium]